MKSHIKRKLKLVSLICLAGSLSGCVVGPDYVKPSIAMPASWKAKGKHVHEAPPELAEWWKQFRDPTLNGLVAEAVHSNLDIATAKAKIRQARASLQQERGTLFPSLSEASSATRNKGTTTGPEPTVYSQYQAGFDASWEIDLFGGARRAVEAAVYAEQSSEEELRDTLVTLIGDVATYYVQAREYQQLVALAQRSAKSQRETAVLTTQQVEVGLASRVDVSKAEAQAASTQADVPSYQISYAKAVNRLAVLLGRSALDLDAQFRSAEPIPSPPRKMKVGIPADILNTRPDIRSAERQLAQATAKVGQAEANRYPSVSLTGSIDTSAASISDLGKKSTIGWSFGPTVTVPIFQGGQLKAAVDVAKAERDQHFFTYQSTVLTALEDVQNAIVSLNKSRARAASLAESVSGYRQAAKYSRDLLAAGESDLFDVLDADRSLYSAQEQLIQANADIATSYVSLNKALGGGWSGPIDVTAPRVEDGFVGPHLAMRKITQ